jgi:acetyl esterase/lipase
MKKALIFNILLAVFTGSVHGQGEQVRNRYGMFLKKQGDGYALVNRKDILAVLGSLEGIEDLYVPCKYVPTLLVPDALKGCKSSEYIYKKYPEYDLAMRLDMPAHATSPVPFVMHIHGGGWATGSYRTFIPQGKYLASNGIAVISVEYSLIPQGATIEHTLSDLRDAFLFIQDHAAEWGLDSTRFGFTGGSAGGHLAAMMAMTTPGVRAAVLNFGLFDFGAKSEKGEDSVGKFKRASGYFLSDDPASLKKYSPVYLIPDSSPAVALYHGTADFHVFYTQSVHFAEALRKKGGEVELNIFKYYQHSFTGPVNSDVGEACVAGMLAFFKKHL